MSERFENREAQVEGREPARPQHLRKFERRRVRCLSECRFELSAALLVMGDRTADPFAMSAERAPVRGQNQIDIEFCDRAQ